MKLLETKQSNTKIKKTQSEYNKRDALKMSIRLASMSLMPDSIICAGSKAANCFETCLKSAGRGAFNNVATARQAKTDYWHADKSGFLAQLRAELTAFAKLCDRQGVQGVVRLNTISDIDWETYNIPQSFPTLKFYDYTKRAHRLGKTPANYKLMLSYSGAPKYQNQLKALPNNVPLAVVFRGELPEHFRGRKVIDGDKSDLVNLEAGGVVIGLRAKGKAKKDYSGFVVDTPKNLIAVGG